MSRLWRAPNRKGRRLPMAMSLEEAVRIAGTLGKTKKMPGASYGIPAQKCITGSQLRNVPGSVCSSCYALTDFYQTWIPLRLGHARRFLGLKHPRWCDAMVRMIEAACRAPQNYFRWHDSGDLQGVWHLEKIVEVCERTYDVHHWLPTREYGTVIEFLDGGGAIPENLVVRLSAHMIDSEPVIPLRLYGFTTSTVSTATSKTMGELIVTGKGSIECKAVEERNNSCGACRACWHPKVRNVQYPQH